MVSRLKTFIAKILSNTDRLYGYLSSLSYLSITFGQCMIVDNLQKEVEKVALIMHEINKKITQSPELEGNTIVVIY